MNKLINLPKDLKVYDYIFIGCGLSTATVCTQIPTDKKILIIEKRNHIGGNIYDYLENNILVHKYGPHIFHTNDYEVFNFINKYTKLNDYRNIVEAKIDEKLIPLPININSIKLLFPNESNDFLNYLRNMFPNRDKITILELSKIDKYSYVYETIYKRVFASYTMKMWNKKVEELDVSVFARVPIYLNETNTYFTDKYEGMPIGGYTKMVEKMLNTKNIDLILNQNIKNIINFKNNKIFINNEEINVPVINCAPLDELFNNKFGQLPYRSLNIKFESLKVNHFQKTAVVNYPEHPNMTRITEYKNFYKEIKTNDYSTIISKEYPGEYNQNSIDFTERYYPIPNEAARNSYKNYIGHCNNIKNLYNLGRLAEYKYINMDQAIKNSLEIAKKILLRKKC
ncbi:UDP-galactopyranose mutase [Mycoplasma elephantis]|uniref:UDP-galactopyranose mutase n=1 Tax=Mycoplasma elephantis TaxID=114882 RepID=UPI000480EB85|nr:UDP-galactopyranose mutase [Mycoplasma elephantis]